MAKAKPTKMFAILGRCRRSGRLSLAPRSSTLALFGSCYLDMQDATVDGELFRMKVTVLFGSATFILPQGAIVRPSGMSLMARSLVDIPEHEDEPGLPTLEIEWTAAFGKLHILDPVGFAALQAEGEPKEPEPEDHTPESTPDMRYVPDSEAESDEEAASDHEIRPVPQAPDVRDRPDGAAADAAGPPSDWSEASAAEEDTEHPDTDGSADTDDTATDVVADSEDAKSNVEAADTDDTETDDTETEDAGPTADNDDPPAEDSAETTGTDTANSGGAVPPDGGEADGIEGDEERYGRRRDDVVDEPSPSSEKTSTEDETDTTQADDATDAVEVEVG